MVATFDNETLACDFPKCLMPATHIIAMLHSNDGERCSSKTLCTYHAGRRVFVIGQYSRCPEHGAYVHVDPQRI